MNLHCFPHSNFSLCGQSFYTFNDCGGDGDINDGDDLICFLASTFSIVDL